MKVIRPREELRPYVRYYWTLKSNEPFSVLTFPIGCPQIIFHRRSPLFVPELSISQYRFTISGQVNFPAHIRSGGNLEMIVAVFHPHAIGMFIDTPPSAFYNLEISGYDIESRRLNELAARIFDCRDNDKCIEILEKYLLSRIDPTLNFKRISSAVNELLYRPYTIMNMLADKACLGKKQFERVFREIVGMNPKEYSRIVRFQKALRLMQCGDTDYIGIATVCGYSDQSHFIREFKAMSGHTPTSLPTVCRPYSDLYTNPA